MVRAGPRGGEENAERQRCWWSARASHDGATAPEQACAARSGSARWTAATRC
jgi:hypothetical protein